MGWPKILDLHHKAHNIDMDCRLMGYQFSPQMQTVGAVHN